MPNDEETGEARTIELQTADGAMPLYEVEPAGGTAERAVIVIQEAFGVNDHIEDVTRRFAALGYLAVAPHVFHRTGGGTVDYDRFDLVMPHFAEISDAGLLTDIDATIAHLTGRGISAEHIGIVGFCMGGRVSFLVASRRRVGAAVGFYGGGILKGRSEALAPLADDVAQMNTPWLGLFGDLDEGIPIEEVEELRRRLAESAPVETEIVRYPDAGHGFHCDKREAYHEASARDGWARTVAWFERFLA